MPTHHLCFGGEGGRDSLSVAGCTGETQDRRKVPKTLKPLSSANWLQADLVKSRSDDEKKSTIDVIKFSLTANRFGAVQNSSKWQICEQTIKLARWLSFQSCSNLDCVTNVKSPRAQFKKKHPRERLRNWKWFLELLELSRYWNGKYPYW